jgi:hypothetical protein
VDNKTKIWLVGLGAGTLVLGALVIAYNKEVKMFSMGGYKFDCSKSYLFIGDSNTAGSTSYADQFMSFCQNPKNKKIAKSGAKTSWMLPELEKELAVNKYDVVTILAGSNDIFARLSINDAKANMDKMFQLAKDNGAKVVSITPPYKGHFPRTTDKHWKLIGEWNEYLRKHPIPSKYIDFSSIVQDKSLFASDNQHVNKTGHGVLKDAFIKTLNIA